MFFIYKSGISVLEIPLLLANCATVNAAARMSTVQLTELAQFELSHQDLS